ncbi:hypothetical protein EDEG_01960 [Edhazardia aedis USNM 41457]|uniref:t-SNARE coiled-coil homology domain-containing protein n=1 Tax=Edhazardia aedis (strain USNM 41457) TaxID=1003232 RepID=J9DME2_EDHAE|nr:hypothetical protein EDEG_01960 [Edhazardia aedis USNM 41457]|eukprot:EJW03765.1 hypothetical protein EDEG_01960 [Edhazardia aedis USNM 41457]
MDDKYSASQYQKFLQKKKEKQKRSPLEEEILEKAAQIEHETFLTAKQARQKLQQSAKQQQKTTISLEAQDEKLENIRMSAYQAKANAKDGEQLAKDIKQAGKVFGFNIPVVSSIKRYFSKGAKMDRELLEQQRRNKNIGEFSADQDEHTDKINRQVEDNDDIDPTDKELMLILDELKGMKGESKKQNYLIKSHKTKIEEIAKVNKNTEHYISKTNKKLKDL